MDDDLGRALAWVDRQIARRNLELALLNQVRGQLRNIVGQGQPDGWAQEGHRGDE